MGPHPCACPLPCLAPPTWCSANSWRVQPRQAQGLPGLLHTRLWRTRAGWAGTPRSAARCQGWWRASTACRGACRPTGMAWQAMPSRGGSCPSPPRPLPSPPRPASSLQSPLRTQSFKRTTRARARARERVVTVGRAGESEAVLSGVPAFGNSGTGEGRSSWWRSDKRRKTQRRRCGGRSVSSGR
jgi:hypothetical protein